jgi:predicted transcriptional regulator
MTESQPTDSETVAATHPNIDLLKFLAKSDHGLDAYRLTEELGLRYRACYQGLKALRKAGLIGGKLRFHITQEGRQILSRLDGTLND